MRTQQEFPADLSPVTKNGRLGERLANPIPSRQTIESALHWLTDNLPPPELADLVAALVAQDVALLGVAG